MGARSVADEIRHLRVLLKFSLREASEGGSLKSLFQAQALRIKQQLEQLGYKPKRKKKRGNTLRPAV